MHRLFAMFPAGRPGFALLLMRVALAAMLVDGVRDGAARAGSAWLFTATALVAIALCIGLLTPIVCALTVLLKVMAWMASSARIETVHVCAVLDAIALLLLGPGAYSSDARLFGRRRVVLDAVRRRPPN